MQTILLAIHLIIALAIIVLVLLQRSEGGALGIGGGGGNFMSSRALGNALTRTTAILGALFFMSSIGLTVLSTMENRSSVLDSVIESEGQGVGQFDTPLPALPIPPQN